MINKIIIPNGLDCYILIQSTQTSFHVNFKEDNVAFEKFCSENNIGYGPDKRQDITKSYNCVFTNDSSVFDNFPKECDIMRGSV